MKTKLISFLFITTFLFSCSKENDSPEENRSKSFTIFFVNDVHARIDNFAKVKHIVDAERNKTSVILASSGDLFTGNPVVDNYADKGYPIIEIMNQVEFDIAVIGNHEYDYGIETLNERIKQSNFRWVCANVETGSSSLQKIPAFYTFSIDDLKVTFLGLVETSGSKESIIPSTHPEKVKELTFQHAKNIVQNYKTIKQEEEADIYIALSHLGHNSYGTKMGDFKLAEENTFFDLIIGGHSHSIIDTVVAGTPIFQSGEHLNNLGQIEVTLYDNAIQEINFKLINLNNYNQYDQQLKTIINTYNDRPELDEVIGHSGINHSIMETGCFYTDALRKYLNVDVSFQNPGGIKAKLEQGDITKRNIFNIAPFNYGVLIYEMTVEEIKEFLVGSESGFYYSGIRIEKVDKSIQIKDLYGQIIPDEQILKIVVNDYIPAIHSAFFPEDGALHPLTDSETLITYLGDIGVSVNFAGYVNYFRY